QRLSEDEDDPSMTAGVALSHDRLAFVPSQGELTRTYSVCLTKRPSANVTMLIRDPSQCISAKRQLLLRTTFTPETFDVPRWVQATLLPDQRSCGQGLVHAFRSVDPEYHGLHVRLFVDVERPAAPGDDGGVIAPPRLATAGHTED